MKIKNIDPLGRSLEVPSLGVRAAHGEAVEVTDEQAKALLSHPDLWAADKAPRTKTTDAAASSSTEE